MSSKVQPIVKHRRQTPLLVDLTSVGKLTAGGAAMNDTEQFTTCVGDTYTFQYAPTTSGGTVPIPC